MALWGCSFTVTLLLGDLAVTPGPLAGPIPGVWSPWGSGAGSSCPVTPHPARCHCPGPELRGMEPFSKEVSRASPQQTLFYGASGFRVPHVIHLHSFPCRVKPLRKSRFLSVSAHLLVPESPASLAVSPTLPSSLCPTGPSDTHAQSPPPPLQTLTVALPLPPCCPHAYPASHTAQPSQTGTLLTLLVATKLPFVRVSGASPRPPSPLLWPLEPQGLDS